MRTSLRWGMEKDMNTAQAEMNMKNDIFVRIAAYHVKAETARSNTDARRDRFMWSVRTVRYCRRHTGQPDAWDGTDATTPSKHFS